MSTKTVIIPQIDTSNQKAWERMRVEPQNSLERAIHNLALAEEVGYEAGIAWSNGIIGTAYAWLSEHEKALEYCFLAIDQLRSSGDKKHEAEILYTISLIFYFLSDFDKQYTYAKRSLNVFEEIGDLSGMASAYNGMGTGLYAGKKYEKALDVLSKAEEHAITAKDQEILARIYDGMGESYLGLERLEEALSFKSKSLAVSNKLGSVEVLTFCHEAVGNIYEKLKDYDKALDHYRQSLALKKESQFELGIGIAKVKIGETLLAAEKLDEAKELLEEVVQIGEDLGSNELLYRSHFALSAIFNNNDTLRKHLHHLNAYYQHKEKYSDESESRKIKDFKLRGKFEQLEEEKEALVTKNNELKRTFDDVKILSSIGNEITSTLDLESIFTIIYERLNSLMDAQGIFVAICDTDKNQLNVPLAIQKGVRDKVFHYSLNDAAYHLPVYAVVNDQAIHINDYPKEIGDYLSVEERVINENVNSLILIPLKVKEIVIGVLLVQNADKNAFTDHHFHLLTNFASYLSIALDNAYLYKTTEAKVEERTEALQTSYKNSELLNKIGQELISTLNFEDVFETLYYNVNKLMDATVFGVRLLNKEEQTVEYQYEYENGERLGEIIVPMTNLNNYSVLCITKNEEIFIRDHENEYKKYVEEVMVVDGEFPYSLLFYPLRDGDEVLGCISIQCFEKFAYTNYHLSIIKTLAQYTSLALLNARRYEQMEEEVESRTKEISRSYENTKLLSEIGKSITSQLSVETIIDVAYSNINKLMDAEGFGIGLHNSENNTLTFPGYVESGESLSAATYDLNDMNRLACVCFNRDIEIVINDFNNDYKKYIDIYVEPQVGKSVTSLIYLPIRSKEKVIGVITVQSFEMDSYKDYQVDMLRSIGVYTGIALENASLYENMEEIVKERTQEVVEQKEKIEESYQNTKLVAQINSDISKSITVESLISSVYENVNTLMDAACFGIGIYEADKNAIKMPGFIENGVKMDEFYYYLDDQRLASWCFKNEKELIINDLSIEYEKYLSGMKPPVSGKDSSSVIYMPLFSKEKIVGLLTVQSFEVNAFQEYHVDILRSLAATVASTVENARLYESLEEKVKERTKEVVLQKEQIEKTAENTRRISEIGKEIASKLNSADIIADVYHRINDIMDASIFGIGIHKEETNGLKFSGAIEKGTKLKDFEYNLDDVRIATMCFNNKQEVVINNWEKEHKNYVLTDYSIEAGEKPVSMIYLPLISKSTVIGVMSVQSFEENSYGDYELDVLRTLSLYVANALDNASLYEEMEDRVKQRTAEIKKAYENTKLLSQISRTIVESLEVEKIIASVYNNINSLLDATCFGIGIHDKKNHKLIFPGFIENNTQIENLEFDIDGDFLATNCFNKGMEIIIHDYNKEFGNFVEEDVEVTEGDETNSIVYLPLSAKDKVIGVLTVQSYKSNAYNNYQLNILRSLATTIATAIDNAVLYESMEEKVRDRTVELQEQKEIIEETNKHLMDSIRYAKRIQDATLPDYRLIDSCLKEAFVLFKPKDIVSGDFYWLERVKNKVLFAVVDCTGHGVPGAFLSLIGHNSLNQIVNELGVVKPGEILNNLNKLLHYTLKSGVTEEHTIRDGMDLTICCLDVDKNILEFAGANNPIYIINNGELRAIKGDKVPIQAGLGIQSHSYTNHVLQLEEGDTIYLFSDGYADQFGGSRGKKLKYKAFKEILLEIHQEKMRDQETILNDKISDWQGELEQIDDICVMGVRV